MPDSTLTIAIGGAAGDGIASVGDLLARVASRSGLHVFIYNSYQSVIRGGHVFLSCRVGETKITAHGDKLHLLIALNQDTLDKHTDEVEPGGLILFNADRFSVEGLAIADGVTVLGLPAKEMMAPHGRLPILQNILLLGAALKFSGLPLEPLEKLVLRQFEHKGEKVVAMNIGVARAGWDAGPEPTRSWQGDGVARAVATGNELLSMGAYAAGCRFYSAYPMTPATGLLHWFAPRAARLGVVVKQFEDEIAVINAAIGANYAGVRAMCGTSGGGFSLMTEAVGMAAMTETPLVVVNVQRGGPSTGLPTKTEQADFNQVYGASQGDFPRAIVAPAYPVDCFRVMAEAFNVADRWQIPVIVLSDLLLSEHNETIDGETLDWDPEIDRGEVVEAADLPAEEGVYLRYKNTPSGVSPRSLPGMRGGTYTAATDEHDEASVNISDVFTNPAERVLQMDKRARKMSGLAATLPAPRVDGPEDADVTLVVWGSTRGVALEAMARLQADGIATNLITLRWLVPFPTEAFKSLVSRGQKVVMIEQNQSGQVRGHIAKETGIRIPHFINRYDGEPMQPGWLVDKVKAVIA
ncbi:2-oxoacid:acceptor oxidoreductase subunit alpha [bacterium]|nr:2-oxoacid:acceptor oxidoreductase subunit alpha [bacterium]